MSFCVRLRRPAAPLVATIGLISVTLVGWHYRRSFEWTTIRPLAIGSIAGIPCGVLALDRANEHFVTLLLGLVIGGYAGYVLSKPAFELSGRAATGNNGSVSNSAEIVAAR